MPRVGATVRMFAPEQWGQVDRFRILSPTTYEFTGHQKRVLAGVENHFQKTMTLLRLSERLLPDLAIDEAELEANGYTPAQNARNLAATIEGVITELYSVVDCTAKVLHIVYGPTSRGFKDSTRRLFACAHAISGSFPDRLKALFGSAAWYRDLRIIRDELTHRDVGSCSTDRETGKVRYFHSALYEGERLKPIDDIFGWVQEKLRSVNEFTGTVFHQLNTTITSGTVIQVCGVVEGRMLVRQLDAAQPIDFDNGICMSAQWFDLPENPRCPFADRCGAYDRKATPEQLRAFYGE